jgi:hypothetical protein
MENKKVHTGSLVLMIIGLLFALIIPIVTYPCSIVSLVLAIKNKDLYKTKLIIILNIVALILALINSIFGVLLQFGLIKL